MEHPSLFYEKYSVTVFDKTEGNHAGVTTSNRETLQLLPDMTSARSMHCARVAFGQCRSALNAFYWLTVRRRLWRTLFHFLVLIREEQNVSSIHVHLLLYVRSIHAL
jgi:hypothetical protein